MINFQKEIDLKIKDSSIEKLKFEQWMETFHQLRQTIPDKQLNDEQLITLFHAASTAPIFKCICTQIYSFSKKWPDPAYAYLKLSQAAASSTYQLSCWLDSMYLVFNWAHKHQVQTHFIHVIFYIQCAEESPENNLYNNNLNALINEMLMQYGHHGI